MYKKSISGRNLENSITSDDILGKNVIDKDGTTVGIVEKVLIDPIKLDFIGLEVDKGFLKKGLSIGKSYIDKITEHAVFLKIDIVLELKGLSVFDKDGKKVGKISKVELWGNKNKIHALYIKRGLVKEIKIPANLIKTIGYSVMLNISEDKIKKSL